MDNLELYPAPIETCDKHKQCKKDHWSIPRHNKLNVTLKGSVPTAYEQIYFNYIQTLNRHDLNFYNIFQGSARVTAIRVIRRLEHKIQSYCGWPTRSPSCKTSKLVGCESRDSASNHTQNLNNQVHKLIIIMN